MIMSTYILRIMTGRKSLTEEASSGRMDYILVLQLYHEYDSYSRWIC